MSRTQRRVRMAVLAVAVGTVVAQPGTASAGPAAPAGAGTTVQVVAEGLNTPRGLLYDRAHRRVLVAEAGDAAGDNAPCGEANGRVVYCLGPTGSVFRYSERTGAGSRILTGLPSIGAADDTSVLGLHDLTLYRGKLTGVFGLSGRQFFRDGQLGPAARPLAQTAILKHNGTVVTTADLVAYEEQVNPHPAVIDSDPYGIATGRYGTVVADAAGNDLLLVARDGTISTLATFPTRVPEANPNDTVESVPTAVVQGPDGAFYVGELSGFPYYQGEARVWRVVPGQPPTVYADGFTNIADVAFDRSGRLIVLEMAMNGLLDPDQTGRLVRVERDGTRTTLATTGLENPGGVAVAGDGVFYVTNRTTSTGGTGQLLRVVTGG